MDAVLLSRIQFGLAAGFHFIFPPLTLGLTLIIVIFESMFYKTNEELYKSISSFFIKILALIFALGVATGIVLEFSFGTNWAEYSRMVGDIFGAPLAAEGIFAFFLESVFLGVLLFGRKKVSRGFYLFAVIMVFLGGHLSALWILIANSWMQTPAGFVMEGGRAVMSDFFAAIFNPSTFVRFFHVVVAAWITGTLFTAGISAWYLLKDRHVAQSKKVIKVSMAIFISMAILQFVSGHIHSVQVTQLQPEKMAAFEALWETTEGAPMSVIGIPIADEQKTYFEIKIPKFLSLLAYFDPNAEVKGLNAFPRDEWPPVMLPYFSYHIMIGLGTLFTLIAVIGGILMARRKLESTRWFLWALVLAIPLPHLANEFGWIAAEVGRQPWAVYRVLKTSSAASIVVPAGQILFTLIMFFAIFTLLLVLFIFILLKLIEKGPQTGDETGY